MKTRIVPEGEDAVFHVISRMAFQSMNLGNAEKHMFRKMLEKQATFSGVQVLSYCLLDNHFHILLKIPHQPTLSDETLFKRYSALYDESDPRHALPPSLLKETLKAGGQPAKELRTQLTARMGSLSIFMKELKQRFGIWYNRKHENSGTLWAKRFDSILIENVKKTLQLVGVYIEMNPVRLNLCKDAKDYHFCTVGEASKGNTTARRWLSQMFASTQWSTTLKKYENTLITKGDVLQSKMVSLQGMKNGVIGSASFIQQWSRYGGKKRKTKHSIPTLLLGGILHVGACALSAPKTFTRYPGMP